MTRQFPCPVTTIFSRRVRPGREADYEAWLAGIQQVASTFPGNQGVTVLRPGMARQGEYVSLVQFDSTEHLDDWMTSPERASWIAKLEDITLDSVEVDSLTGMEKWFTLPDRAVSQAPAKYKSAVLIFLGLYPLQMLLGALLDPWFGAWPAPVRILAYLTVSVPVMVWGLMPLLTRVFFGWLYPDPAMTPPTRSFNRS